MLALPGEWLLLEWLLLKSQMNAFMAIQLETAGTDAQSKSKWSHHIGRADSKLRIDLAGKVCPRGWS